MPETLELGPRRPRRVRFASRGPVRWWWVALAAALVVAVPLVHVAVWWSTRPPPDFTLSQLQDAYYGMVRSDGSNDLSTFTAASRPAGGSPFAAIPAECTPMFAPTVANRLPDGVADGVSTYWLNEGGTSIALTTLRYPTTAQALAGYQRIGSALERCVGVQVRFTDLLGAGVVRTVAVAPTSGVASQTAYLLDQGSDGRFAFQVMQLANTITWQYRYDAGTVPGYNASGGRVTLSPPYQGQAAQQLMDGLALQLLAVQQR